ncbi:MAG: helix-turn-helix domain-containing protein [Oscillospiraceae bacterium]|nr:helix-turn-helix domain-containing protein [Oscillospiraceae bacterium]
MKKIEYNAHKNVICQQLKKIRIAAGMSQSQTAAKMQTMGINIDQQMISKIENDNRIVTDYELACFCRIFNVKEKDLLKDFYDNRYE